MTMSSEVVPTQYLLLLRPVFFSRCPKDVRRRRLGSGQDSAPDSLKFVQNLVLNVSRKETKDILSGVPCGTPCGTPWTNYLSREAPESEKLYIRKSDKLFIVY